MCRTHHSLHNISFNKTNPTECDVCYDTKDNFAIMKCSHKLCTDCFYTWINN
jgi:hypothetical protein